MKKFKEPKPKSALAVGSRKLSVGHKIALILFSLMLFILILFPFYWIILSSFKNFLEIFEVPIRFVPKRLDFTNYKEVFTEYHIGTYLINSVVVTVVTVLITTSISTMASFSLTRLQFKGSKAFVKFLQMSQMFPVVVILVPLYLMCTRMGLV
ncbi:MAG: carbohydrate ABC transporter permease, partial [Spirochaetales bacterium]|nr:carbohydrate ABC transporter permease [Spirochaetales bacterium]